MHFDVVLSEFIHPCSKKRRRAQFSIHAVCVRARASDVCAENFSHSERLFRQQSRASYRPLHGIRHRKIRSSQCACRGQKVHSIPLNCMLTREFLVKTKCLLVASWTVKIAPVLESSFSGFLQDLIRLKKNRRHLWLQAIKRADWDNTVR